MPLRQRKELRCSGEEYSQLWFGERLRYPVGRSFYNGQIWCWIIRGQLFRGWLAMHLETPHYKAANIRCTHTAMPTPSLDLKFLLDLLTRLRKKWRFVCLSWGSFSVRAFCITVLDDWSSVCPLPSLRTFTKNESGGIWQNESVEK